MVEPSDRALLERTLRDDDLEAYGELVRRYQGSVFNVCYRLMGERQGAEDQTQEAFIRVHDRLDTFDLDRPFGPWIRRVAANLCYNELRSKGPIEVPFDPERELAASRPGGNPELQHRRSELAERVGAALRDLPPHYRAVIELRHYQELSYREIAKALDFSMSEVETYLYRARKALADDLAPEGQE